MKAPKSLRVWFAVMGAVLWFGIYLTGFSNVIWVIYLPATGLAVAAITGFCPVLFTSFKLFGVKLEESSTKKSQ